MAEEIGEQAIHRDITNTQPTVWGSRLIPPPPDISVFEDVLKKRSEMVSPEQLAGMAQRWETAFNNFHTFTYGVNRDPQASDYWDEEAMREYSNFRARIEKTPIFLRTNSSEDEKEEVRKNNYAAIERIVSSPTFPARRSVVKILQHDLWMNRPYAPEEAEDEFDKQKRADFIEKKVYALPIMEAAVRIASSQGDSATLKEVFDGYFNIAAEYDAKSILCMSGLNAAQRLQVAVGYSNTFGFISAIDVISHQAKSTADETLRLQYEDVYKSMQGENVTKIMRDLSDVYSAVNFDKYSLSTQELTINESDLIEITTNEISRERRIPLHDVTILDLGAGTGRLTKELTDRGYKKVVAVEYEQPHADIIREKAPTATVIQGSWVHLEELMQGKRVDVIASVMRSLCHNRKISEMVHVFDECREVVDPITGKIIFDMPNIKWGEYRTRIHHLAENLRSLGIMDINESDIFDGPDEEHKFNRKVLRPEQVDAVARVLGFKPGIKVAEVGDKNEDSDNIYYEFEIDPEFDPRQISMKELSKNANILGLYGPGTDYEMYVKAWGMTLGQALTFGLHDDEVRMLNEQGRPPHVLPILVGDKIQFKGTYS